MVKLEKYNYNRRIRRNRKRPLANKLGDEDIKKPIINRNEFYAKADYKIECENKTKLEIVEKIIKNYENFRLQIRTKDQKYSILIGNNIEKLDKIINNERIVFNNCLIIFDNNLPKKFLNKVKKKLKKKYLHINI